MVFLRLIFSGMLIGSENNSDTVKSWIGDSLDAPAGETYVNST